MKEGIFVSSAQRELAEERRAVRDFVVTNPPMFLAGYGKKAGTGVLDLIALCRRAGLPTPEFRQDEGQFVQTLRRPAVQATPQVTPQVAPQVEEEPKALSEKDLLEIASLLGISATQVTTQVATQIERVLAAAEQEPRSREDRQTAAGLSDREHFRKAYLEPLLAAGWLEWTVPDKPASRLQKYRLTERGRSWLAERLGAGDAG